MSKLASRSQVWYVSCTHVVVAAHLDTVASTDTTVGDRGTLNIGVFASGAAAVEVLTITAHIVLVVVVVVVIVVVVVVVGGRLGFVMGSGESASGNGEESKNGGGELHVEGF
jgi:hypothetical protein